MVLGYVDGGGEHGGRLGVVFALGVWGLCEVYRQKDG